MSDEDNTKDSPILAAEDRTSCCTKVLKGSPKESVDVGTTKGDIFTENNKFAMVEEKGWSSHQQHKSSSLTVVEEAQLKSAHPSLRDEENANPRYSHRNEDKVSSIIGGLKRGVYFDVGGNDNTATSSQIENNKTGYLEAIRQRRSGVRVTHCRSSHPTTDQNLLRYQKMLNAMTNSFHRKLGSLVSSEQEMQLQLEKAKLELKSERHEREHRMDDFKSECDKLRDELAQVQEQVVGKETQIIQQTEQLSKTFAMATASNYPEMQENMQGEVQVTPQINETEFFETNLVESQEGTDKRGCTLNISPRKSPKEVESIYPGTARQLHQRLDQRKPTGRFDGAPTKDLFEFSEKLSDQQAWGRGNDVIGWSPSIKKSSSLGDCVRPVQLVSADEGAQEPGDKDSKRRSERAFAA